MSDAAFLMIMQYERFSEMSDEIKETFLKYSDANSDELETEYNSFLKYQLEYTHKMQMLESSCGGKISVLGGTYNGPHQFGKWTNNRNKNKTYTIYDYHGINEDKLMDFILKLKNDDDFDYIDEYHRKIMVVVAKRLIDWAYSKRTGTPLDVYIDNTAKREKEKLNITHFPWKLRDLTGDINQG